MAKNENKQAGQYTPDFELPKHDVIHEDNWPQYQARGFVEVSELGLDLAQSLYGAENVYTGDSYDYSATRPLRHKPGIGVYVSPDGLKRREAVRAEWERLRDERSRQHQGDDPETN